MDCVDVIYYQQTIYKSTRIAFVAGVAISQFVQYNIIVDTMFIAFGSRLRIRSPHEVVRCADGSEDATGVRFRVGMQ